MAIFLNVGFHININEFPRPNLLRKRPFDGENVYIQDESDVYLDGSKLTNPISSGDVMYIYKSIPIHNAEIVTMPVLDGDNFAIQVESNLHLNFDEADIFSEGDI